MNIQVFTSFLTAPGCVGFDGAAPRRKSGEKWGPQDQGQSLRGRDPGGLSCYSPGVPPTHGPALCVPSGHVPACTTLRCHLHAIGLCVSLKLFSVLPTLPSSFPGLTVAWKLPVSDADKAAASDEPLTCGATQDLPGALQLVPMVTGFGVRNTFLFSFAPSQ